VFLSARQRSRHASHIVHSNHTTIIDHRPSWEHPEIRPPSSQGPTPDTHPSIHGLTHSAGDAFGDHDGGDVRGGGGDIRHDRRVDHTEAGAPRTAPAVFTTAQGSLSVPIGAVEVGCC
jgi:hypothetical protein